MSIESTVIDHGEAMRVLGAAEGRNDALAEAANRLLDEGHTTAARIVLDMMHAGRMSSFVLTHHGAPRSPQLGVAREATTPAGAMEV